MKKIGRSIRPWRVGVDLCYQCRVARILFAVAFTVFLAQASGAYTYLLGGGSCAQTCDDDQPDGWCAPTCMDCACCGHARLVTIKVGLTVPDFVPRWLPGRAVAHVVLDPAPRDIAHVPITPLA